LLSSNNFSKDGIALTWLEIKNKNKLIAFFIVNRTHLYQYRSYRHYKKS
jgi:hypothetical protein